MKILQTYIAPNTPRNRRNPPFWIDNMVPCSSHDSPPLTPQQLHLLTNEPDVLFLITRSKNANTVVYRKTSDSIEAFWQRFAERPVDASVSELRAELRWYERKMAYGISFDPSTSTAHVVATPHLKLHLAKDERQRYRLFGTVDGRPCILLRIFVSASESLIPTVNFVNVHAIDQVSGQELVQKIL